MKDFKKVVAQRIKAARTAAGFSTQAALADRLRVDQSRVARWESGENLPRGAHREALLKEIRKTEIEIFGHHEDVAEPGALTYADAEMLLAAYRKAGDDIRQEVSVLLGLAPALRPEEVLDRARRLLDSSAESPAPKLKNR